jgi:hypothetical protein
MAVLGSNGLRCVIKITLSLSLSLSGWIMYFRLWPRGVEASRICCMRVCMDSPYVQISRFMLPLWPSTFELLYVCMAIYMFVCMYACLWAYSGSCAKCDCELTMQNPAHSNYHTCISISNSSFTQWLSIPTYKHVCACVILLPTSNSATIHASMISICVHTYIHTPVPISTSAVSHNSFYYTSSSATIHASLISICVHSYIHQCQHQAKQQYTLRGYQYVCIHTYISTHCTYISTHCTAVFRQSLTPSCHHQTRQ